MIDLFIPVLGEICTSGLLEIFLYPVISMALVATFVPMIRSFWR